MRPESRRDKRYTGQGHRAEGAKDTQNEAVEQRDKRYTGRGHRAEGTKDTYDKAIEKKRHSRLPFRLRVSKKVA